MEGGVETVALDGEGGSAGEVLLPGDGLHPFKQGVKIGGVEGAQHQQHPLTGAQVQIEAGDVPRTAGTQHMAVFRPYIGQIQAAQLVGGQTFQAEQGGNKKLQLVHKNLRGPRRGGCVNQKSGDGEAVRTELDKASIA